MTHKPKLRATAPSQVAKGPRPADGPALDADEIDTDDGHERILARPNGYYWLAPDGRQEIGPFDSLSEALADMDSGDAAGWAPGETLAEAESEIGVSDWIDSDSGSPAEGQGPTHLERE